jgi:hypothetical protein
VNTYRATPRLLAATRERVGYGASLPEVFQAIIQARHQRPEFKRFLADDRVGLITLTWHNSPAAAVVEKVGKSLVWVACMEGEIDDNDVAGSGVRILDRSLPVDFTPNESVTAAVGHQRTKSVSD